MAFCRVVLSFLFLSVVSCSVDQPKVPVYVWGDLSTKSFEVAPFSTLSTTKFLDYVESLRSNDLLTVVFVEETLSVEDFSLKNDDGETVYSNLHMNLGDAVYMPSVSNPLKVLNIVEEPAKVQNFELTEKGLDNEINAESIQDRSVLIINLKDASEGESRANMLQRHDQFMQDTIQNLKDNLPEDMGVLAVYTAYGPSWTIPTHHHRVRRETSYANTTTIYTLDGLRLAVASIELSNGNNTTPLSGLTGHSSEINSTSMSSTLQFDTNSITLNFKLQGGYWFFDSVHLNLPSVAEDLYTNDEVYALDSFSYRCQQRVVFASINQTQNFNLTFTDMKVQPFFRSTNASEPFGDSFNCVGYFSAAIWAGLFVVAILLLIMFYGIMMMMDIKTMDRFDDPKGKTITINAGE